MRPGHTMVSWIIPIAGAVITPLACKRDLFNKKGKGNTALPTEHRGHADRRFLDRRRKRAI